MSDLIQGKTILPVPPGFRPNLGRDGNGVPIIAVDMPVMYEDEGQEEMGESEYHFDSDHIIHTGVKAHLAGQPRFRVFSNLNVYYHPVDRWAYVSPDTMVVELERELPEKLTSYRIGEDGPAPRLTVEVLSRRSFQQQDLSNKPIIYSNLSVQEYILVDVTGQFLAEKLLLKCREKDGNWIDMPDADGGVTSQLGFRIILEPDGEVRVVDVKTGRKYLRPDEAEDAVRRAEVAAENAVRRVEAAEEQIRVLQERLQALERERNR